MSPLTLAAPRRPTGFSILQSVTLPETAVSEEAKVIRGAAVRLMKEEERSFFLFGARQVVISDVWALFDEEPVSLDAALQAESFIRALPEKFPLPELAADPDGSISLDWVQSRNRMLSLSVGESPRLPYAWVDGGDSGYAVAFFDGETVPERILEGIRSTLRSGNTPLRPR